MNLWQDQSCCSKLLQQLVMGFGILLPSPQYSTCDAEDGNKTAFQLLSTTSPASLNAYILSTISGITFEWTDALAHHLELDTSERVPYLYRFPSFCLANMCNTADEKVGGNASALMPYVNLSYD